MEPQSMIKIALADDHTLVRSGIRTILQSEPGFKIVWEAADGLALLNGLETAKPDVILLDLEMPVMSGKECLEAIRKTDSETRVLILTMHKHQAFILQMMEAGANGYLIKDSKPEEMIKAVKHVYHQEYYFSEDLSKAMLSGLTNPNLKAQASLKSHGLLEREIDVLCLICQEKTTTEIADELFLSPKTIEGYRKALFEKTGARNMAGLVLFAVKQGLVEP